MGAGTGSVFILRWFWWRINAWSEVFAMLTAFVVSVGLQVGFGLDTDKPLDFAWLMIITVADHHCRLASCDVPHRSRKNRSSGCFLSADSPV